MTISWPESVLCLRHYDAKTFSSDLVAGITVGLVALPLAMAFAISSGVSPESGLYCAVITGFLISALGGSKVQIGGPTGAFVVVVSGIIAKHGIDGLYTCMLFAGIMLAILGLTGMGTAVKFIPRPVVIGFTNGIALLIASTQIKDFFGLKQPAWLHMGDNTLLPNPCPGCGSIPDSPAICVPVNPQTKDLDSITPNCRDEGPVQ